jgi:hypothetical protein
MKNLNTNLNNNTQLTTTFDLSSFTQTNITCSDKKEIYAYDVNSLYPFVMKECDMPTGNPVYFQGDIRAVDKNAFGFFFCNIIAPENLDHPILQTHVKTINGIRTVAPLGQ